MKILVFIKQVPNADDVKLDPKTGNLQREGVESILNPPDANAVEMALELKETYGGTITVLTMGLPQADDVLKKALSMGCDESVLLSDRPLGGADTLATGYTLAQAAKKVGDYDLILCGRHAIDAETAQTGPIMAAFLGIPQVTLAKSVGIDGGFAICERLLPDRTEKVKVKLPALVTVCTESNTPRYATPIGIMKALKKPRYTWTAADMDCDMDMIGSKGSATVTKDLFEPPKHNTETSYFEGSVEEMAREIADVLEREHVI